MIVTTSLNNGLCRLDSKIQKRVNEACGDRHRVHFLLAFEEHCDHDILASGCTLKPAVQTTTLCSETYIVELRLDSRDVLCGRARLVGAKHAMQVGDRNLCCFRREMPRHGRHFTEASKLLRRRVAI